MKLKKEDAGLYFALALVGGGVGLLVGAIVASKLDKRSDVEDENEPLIIEDGEIYLDVESSQNRVATSGEIDVEEVEIGQKFPKQRKTKATRELRDAFDSDEEYEEYIELYEPNKTSIEMYRNNLLELEELTEFLSQSKAANEAEPYSYSGVYMPDEIDKKPDLDELTEALDVDRRAALDERYHIFVLGVEDEVPNTTRDFFYDPKDGSLIFLSRKGHPMPVVDISNFIEVDVWEIVLRELAENTKAMVYVLDKNKDEYFGFESYGTGDEEDPAVKKGSGRS